MEISLKNKNALVCGSTQGIGKAIAMELASLGARISLFARNKNSLKQVTKNLPVTNGQKHDYLVADFFNSDKVNTEIERYINNGNIFHIVINNTGGPPPGLAIDSGSSEYVKGFNAHLVNSQNIARAVVPGMINEGYGRIINIISTSVKAPIPGLGVSNTIRGAMANWAKTLSVELGPYRITVNNVLPGFTKTGRLDQLFNIKAEELGLTQREFTQQITEKIPARRLAEPSETAAAVAFLASPSASYINGINLPVDGGNTPSL
jgi:3-oxoacyl-[acyl-carrier protein] reductase